VRAVDTSASPSAQAETADIRDTRSPMMPQGRGVLDGLARRSSVENLVQNTLWYRHRLAAMSAGEIGHRIVERLKRTASRRYHPTYPLPGRLLPLPGLAEGLRTFRGDDRLIEEWREVAHEVVAGRISLLGATWQLGSSARRWHLDPITGNPWPHDTYCFDIPYRRNHHFGDVKYVWELNRLQHLQPVAALAALDCDAELARFCCREIESWIDANRPFHGVNWASGIELALRVASMFVTASLLDSVGLFHVDRRKLWATLAAHGYWLQRFPSRFSSANNHRVAEAGGLYLLGLLAPELPSANGWARFGRQTLIAEALRQIHPDGVGAEQSLSYLAFTLEWLLLCAATGERSGQPFPEEFWHRIEKAGEFLRWITDSKGAQPRIGDDDEGEVFRSRLAHERYITSILGSLASVTKRHDLAPPGVVPHLRQAFFGRPHSSSSGPTGARNFADGGYTVVRSSPARGEYLLAFDHGPLGFLSIAAHGHADALSFWLHLGGQPIIVDAGTYLYHAGGVWRDHFRGTSAHNTLSIAGADSSRIAGPFNWSRRARSVITAFNGDSARWHVEAEHDGFLRPFGVRHRRRVERTAPDGFLVTDTLRGTGGPFDVEIGFLFHPSLEVDIDGRVATVGHRRAVVLVIDADAPLTGSIERGRIEPMRGWYSSAFGRKEPTNRLVFRGRLHINTPCRFAMRIWPPSGKRDCG
jgi:Heparinase II/III-like protein/Heparinase II/III N-terminus